MEPVVFMPTTLAGHMAKHCNHMVNNWDENNNIGGVYKKAVILANLLTPCFNTKCENMVGWLC